LGQNETAIESYNDGLVVSPNNDALLVARGIHRYGDDPGAVTDFLNAVRLGTSLIWPYIFLAHYYVTSGQFENCRRMCEQGLTKPGSNTVRSELAEWLAISQSELGYPTNVVRASFDSAIEYDPSNERARRNLAAFESATQPIPASVYETRNSRDIRTSSLADRKLRRAA
jgi:hypothetical protein